jgi:hypothetical protein
MNARVALVSPLLIIIERFPEMIASMTGLTTVRLHPSGIHRKIFGWYTPFTSQPENPLD